MKRIFAMVGLVASIIVIIMGIVIATSSPNNEMFSAYPSLYYDYGYAQFGSDYYSYSNNNAAHAAEASKAAGYQTKELDKTVRTVGGMLLLAVGMMGLGAFGMAVGCEAPKKNAPSQEPCVDSEISNAPEPSEASAPSEADTFLT